MEKDPRAVRFGQRLRELREVKGMSRKQLAEAMKLSERAVIQWELGEREPGWFNVLALCAALGVTCEAFTKEPAPLPPPQRGRPRKTPAPEGEPARSKPAKASKRKRG